jgi:hypothetical protein
MFGSEGCDMFRIATGSILVLASVGVAGAGQIQLGGANGLTSSYIAGGCSGTPPCGAGSLGSLSAATEGSYDGVLFSGANNGGTAPSPPSGTVTDPTSFVTFSLINDGVGNNVWSLPDIVGSTANTMTIPVGVFGVTDVWTMINDELGSGGLNAVNSPYRDLTVVFNFGTTSNATTTESVLVKTLNSGTSPTAAANGQVRNAVNCTGPPPCGGISPPASGPVAPSASMATYVNGVLSSNIGVQTNNLYSTGYTDASGAYSTSSGGTVSLDDQGFLLGDISLGALGAGDTNLNTYLVSVQIREVGVTGAPGEAVGLSAITVLTTPEPSTVLLFLAGLGAIGLARYFFLSNTKSRKA